VLYIKEAGLNAPIVFGATPGQSIIAQPAGLRPSLGKLAAMKAKLTESKMVNQGMAPTMMGGFLKLHLVEAHLAHNTSEFMLEKMNPFVLIRIGMQEWRSAVCEQGGRNPRWTF
jgi:hypothetical protein